MIPDNLIGFALTQGLESLDAKVKQENPKLRADTVCYVANHKNGYEIVCEDPYTDFLKERIQSALVPQSTILRHMIGNRKDVILDVVKHEDVPTIDRKLRNFSWEMLRYAWTVMGKLSPDEIHRDLKKLLTVCKEDINKPEVDEALRAAGYTS